MDIQALVAEFASEALQVAVLHRLTGLDEIQGDVVLVGPGIQHLPRELGAVVKRDLFRRAVPEDQLIEQTHDLLSRQ